MAGCSEKPAEQALPSVISQHSKALVTVDGRTLPSDLNHNGKLDTYEDVSQPIEARG
ncbi:MAG: hypothetical protein R2788_03040 [Saprospiraceae bacterium]